MKYTKYIAFFVLGSLFATAAFYAGLLSWGALFFEAGDSYLDREPRVADALFVLWLICSLMGGAVGVWLARRRP
jgi:hypothetical protein